MKVDPSVLEKLEKEESTIKEIKPGIFQGPWLPYLYDNRSECWRENIAERNRQLTEKAGLNRWGQTPEQQKTMSERVKKSTEIKEKAAVAEQMLKNNS